MYLSGNDKVEICRYISLSGNDKVEIRRYMYLCGNDKVVRGKKGSDGVHIFKTNQVIILLILYFEDKDLQEHPGGGKKNTFTLAYYTFFEYLNAKNILQAVIIAIYSEPLDPGQV